MRSWGTGQMTNDMTDALILAPIGRDAAVAASILADQRLTSRICSSISNCIDGFEEAYCFIVTEEALLAEDRGRLAEWVNTQPTWSDFPLVLLTTRGGPIDSRLAFLSDYAVALERPFGPQALVAAVRAAVRARKRQLEVKSFLDERDRVDGRQRLLIRELHHRVKNTLANVQAVLGATARSSSSIEIFYKAFSARVQSLAQTHSFLTDDYWQTASLQDILQAELSPYDNGSGRLKFKGPKVSLNADQAVPIGMAIHELATNSAKYGALSAPEGVLDVEWATAIDQGNERLSLAWRESEGPQVKAPTSTGFGTVLIERVLKVQLDATVDMNFRPDGLCFTLSLPLKRDRLVPEYEQASA